MHDARVACKWHDLLASTKQTEARISVIFTGCGAGRSAVNGYSGFGSASANETHETKRTTHDGPDKEETKH